MSITPERRWFANFLFAIPQDENGKLQRNQDNGRHGWGSGTVAPPEPYPLVTQNSYNNPDKDFKL